MSVMSGEGLTGKEPNVLQFLSGRRETLGLSQCC